MQGNLFPFIQVGMQKVNLTPTVTMTDGEKVMTPNEPVYIYDTSGPFSDSEYRNRLEERASPYAQVVDYIAWRRGTTYIDHI